MQNWISSRVRKVCLLVFLLVSGASLVSMTLVDASLQELTVESDKIVIGTITDIQYQWADDTRRSIVTNITVEINNYLKGDDGSATVVFRQIGGQIGDFGQHVDGNPVFKAGDEVALFLVAHRGSYWVHSFALGAYYLATENDGSQYVINDLRGHILLDAETREKLQNEEAAYKLYPLNHFIARVASYIK